MCECVWNTLPASFWQEAALALAPVFTPLPLLPHPLSPSSPAPPAQNLASGGKRHSSHASKLEAIASAAVRCAEKVQASLLVVYTHTGVTAQLVVSPQRGGGGRRMRSDC